MNQTYSAIIVGGGAAGYFGACRLKRTNPKARVAIIEQSRPLQKVLISGGGRCNVTHACFEPAELVLHYPRGSQELLGPFHRFGPGDTMQWFEERGVELKIEEDGRVFPTSNRSESIANCLINECHKLGVEVITGQRVSKLRRIENGFQVETKNQPYDCKLLLLTTGGNKQVWDQVESLGHTIVSPVPSLFTFHLTPPVFKGLEGLSCHAELSVPELGLRESGPVLITHWGISGPAVLRLSAWGARKMFEHNYRFRLIINFMVSNDVEAFIQEKRKSCASKKIEKCKPSHIPGRLWHKLLEISGIAPQKLWADLTREEMEHLINGLTKCCLQVNGKSNFKEEFVTAGGVKLDEIDFRKMESKKIPGLYFAGEITDIDAITGGFNFQNAWTCAWIAGEHMAKQIEI